jgi:hypothetical protein
MPEGGALDSESASKPITKVELINYKGEVDSVCSALEPRTGGALGCSLSKPKEGGVYI